ncbi:MAG: zinc ribbon domain-containing protein [Chloroflexi bacterium]|jgi:hypothetical protein|nr:zinc ribbon domain-containing protein [Chloroflexota bacterium]
MDQIFREIGNTIAGIFSSEIVQLALRGIGIYVVILWLATAFWAYQDMKSRTSNPILPFLAAALIVAFTPIFFIFAAIIYRIIRPHERVGEAHERMLAEEAMLAEVEQLDHCAGCGRRIAEGWMVCPSCRTRLRRPCPSCGKLAGADWIVCAWCGVDFERQPGRPIPAAAATAGRPSRGQAPQAAPAPSPARAQATYAPAAYAPASPTYPAATPAYAGAPTYAGAPGDAAGWPAPPAAASLDRTSASRSTPVAAAEPAPTVSQATRIESPSAASRGTAAPAPSPFRSTTPDLDAEDLGSLVTDPAPVAAEDVVAPAPARVSGRRSSGR